MLCKILRIEEKVGGTPAGTQHPACEVDPESSLEDHDQQSTGYKSFFLFPLHRIFKYHCKL